jgi:Uma2 family endonuclease
MATVLTPSEQKVILQDVSWETYERLLADFSSSSAPRLTYDRGTLEIMSPLPENEDCNRALESLVEAILVEWDLDFRNLGSTTFKRKELQRGFEPDSCFYVQTEARVRGKQNIDLALDPPPDLVIEIGITHSSLDKLPLYEHLGVAEVWRFDGKKLTFFVLKDGAYQESERSLSLPGVRAEVVEQFMGRVESTRRPPWIREVRDWARSIGRPDMSSQGSTH